MRHVIVIENGKQRTIMTKRRNNAKRYPSGQIVHADRGETEGQVLATAMYQRMKKGATEANFRAQEWSCPLGQLRMMAKVSNNDGQGLSDRQYESIKKYVLVRHLERSAQGYPPEHPKSISGGLVAGSGGSSDPIDPETINSRRRAFSAVRSELLYFQGRGVKWCGLLDHLARDEPVDYRDIGEVRMAANVLARFFGM